MTGSLPLMNDLPRREIPTGEPLVLASGSPRRAELLAAAGYQFEVIPAADSVECGICSRETAPEMVARLAFRKAADVAVRPEIAERPEKGFILAGDTVASCVGQILGKPADRDHAESMLRLLSGRTHDVYSGICVWSITQQKCAVGVVRTRLAMRELDDETMAGYLDTLKWEGKAGAFGYQDGNDWLSILDDGSPSNVVGLPMERLAEMLEQFGEIAENVNIQSQKW